MKSTETNYTPSTLGQKNRAAEGVGGVGGWASGKPCFQDISRFVFNKKKVISEKSLRAEGFCW